MSLSPLINLPNDPRLAALPKADLHVHQEERARLDRVLARHAGRPAFDWRDWVQQLLATVPPGMARLNQLFTPDATLPLAGVQEDEPELIIDKIADALAEGAREGAILVEVRFGAAGLALLRPDFMALFREAERQVRTQYPHFCAEALGLLLVADDPARLSVTEQHLSACLRLAREGLGGVDFLVVPYECEADPALWQIAYGWAA